MTSPDLLIRDIHDEDHQAITEVLTTAFEQQNEANLVEQLRTNNALVIERIAEINDVIVGYVAFSQVTSKPATDGLLLGLAPVGVAPDHQHKGVGRALVEDGLRACRQMDPKSVIVLGDPGYYARFGFKPASRYGVSWAHADAGDAFQLIHMGKHNHEPPRKIHFHPAFDAVS